MGLAVIILKAWAHMLHMFNMAATSFVMTKSQRVHMRIIVIES